MARPQNLLAALVVAGVLAAGIAANIVADGSKLNELTSGPAPQTVRKAMWGDALVGPEMLSKYRDLGVGIYQMPARWNEIAPTEPADPTNPKDPAYKWPPYIDPSIAESAKHGMQVQLMLIGVPKWANGGRSWQWAPNDPGDFGDFATALSKRYAGVKLWMIWDEPSREEVFRPFEAAPPTGPLNEAQAQAPRNYARMLDAAYGAVKDLDPKDLIIGGNTHSGAGAGAIPPEQWIRHMRLPNGEPPRMDMYGHNPTTYRRPDFGHRPTPKGIVEFSDLQRLAGVIDQSFPGQELKLYLGEWGIATGYGIDTVDEETQTKWIEAAFRLIEGWDRIYTVSWITPIDRVENGIELIGLLDAEGDPTPLYYAYKAGLN